MRNLFIFLLLIFSHSLFSQTFKVLKTQAKDVAVNPVSGQAVLSGLDGRVFRYDARTGKRILVADAQKKARYVTVDRRGEAHWTGDSKVYNRQGQIPTRVDVSDLDCTLDGKLLMTNTRGVGYVKNSNWTALTKSTADAQTIVGRSDRDYWILKRNKTIISVKNGVRKTLSGKGLDIAFDRATGSLYVVGISKRVFKWDPRASRFNVVRGSRSDILRVAVHRGIIWGVTTSKRLVTTATVPSRVLLQTSTSSTTSQTTNPYKARYRVTMTKLYTKTPNNLFDASADMYGVAGIRLIGKGKSGNVEIRDMKGQKPRMLDISRGAPILIKADLKSSVNGGDGAESKTFYGAYEIGKYREYNIQGELANASLRLNVQINLAKKGLIDDKFGWTQRNIMIKDIKMGQEYLLVSKKGNKEVAIGFEVEKIN
ncbi:MAG: hypothetical protein AAF206_09040 [Bacteroidota bacterium]